MANTICWFEIGVANLERAKNFYGQVLNKPLEITNHGDFEMVVFPHDEKPDGTNADVAGCLYTKTDFIANNSDLMIYFDVNKRINEAMIAVTANGGKVVEPVQAIGPWGYRAVILDSEGNKVALHAMLEK